MSATDGRVRVAVLGSGGWARRTHIPNLQKLDVDIVALCDVNDEAAQQATGPALPWKRTSTHVSGGQPSTVLGPVTPPTAPYLSRSPFEVVWSAAQ